ncbi:MAG: restriction endonuclease subunit S [Melioribacteraceae bacterium]|nr:restriction endonuclease subunit S [Melioribacteraceae bacterium]
MVLQLAVQGKLTETKKEDSIDKLIFALNSEISSLVRRRCINNQYSLNSVSRIPWKPEWRILPLRKLFYSISIKKHQIKTNEYKNTGKYPVVGQGIEKITAYSDNDSKLIKIQSPLIVFGDHTREIKFVDFDFIPGADGTKLLLPINPINAKYFYWALKSIRIVSKGYARHFKSLLENNILLPPLQEQHEIVKKVNSLMSLLDELEEKKNRKEANRIKLSNSALDKLTKSQNEKEFQLNWNRITQNFEILYSVPENVNKLKQTILQLAVQGKLTEQWRKENPDVEPASELLKNIKAEKEKLIAEGKIKKQPARRGGKELPAITEEEKPFSLPDGWEWVSLQDISTKITDGTHNSPPNHSKGDFKYISAKDIKLEGVVPKKITFVEAQVHRAIYERCNPEYGDILYIKDGATTGVATLNNLKEEFSMLSSVALIKTSSFIIEKYILLNLRSPYYYAQTRGSMTGVAITRVTLAKLNVSKIALPPILEQKQIVKKVDQFMSLCKKLEDKIKLKTEEQEKLVEAVVSKLAS